MSLLTHGAEQICVKFLRGAEEIGARLGACNTRNALAGQEALKAGNIDEFYRLGFVGKNKEALKRFENMNWFDRQILVFRNWIAEIFAAPKLLIDKGIAAANHGFDDLVKFATHHTQKAAVKAADVITADALASVKTALASDELVKKALLGRLQGVPLDKLAYGEERVLQALTEYFAHMDTPAINKLISSLKLNGKQQAELKVAIEKEFKRLDHLYGNKVATGQLEIMAKEGGGYHPLKTTYDVTRELDSIAVLTVLEREGHLPAIVGAKNNRSLEQQLRGHVDSTYTPYAFGKMDRHQFNALDDIDKAAHQAKFKDPATKAKLIADAKKQGLDMDALKEKIQATAPTLNKPKLVNSGEENTIIDLVLAKRLEDQYGLVDSYDEAELIRQLIGQHAKTPMAKP